MCFLIESVFGLPALLSLSYVLKHVTHFACTSVSTFFMMIITHFTRTVNMKVRELGSSVA